MSLHPHYAVCDVGTNSVRLMLADEALRPLYKTLVTTRIGDELATTSRLSEGGMARTLTALSEYRYAAEEYNLPLWAFATSAVRDAENKEEFLARCEDRGLFLEVVSGETEGMLGFLGVGGPARPAWWTLAAAAPRSPAAPMAWCGAASRRPWGVCAP